MKKQNDIPQQPIPGMFDTIELIKKRLDNLEAEREQTREYLIECVQHKIFKETIKATAFCVSLFVIASCVIGFLIGFLLSLWIR